MLFNSAEFALFFFVVCVLYFRTPYRFRWVFLLSASYFFYASWNPLYLVLILASTVVDYLAGLSLGRATARIARLGILWTSLATNLGLLFLFKYFNFFADALRAQLHGSGLDDSIPHLDLLLPVGISFYTFQTLSYTIEVYRGTQQPERHLGIFALYVAFFPQLVAGPIERSRRFLPQLHSRFDFDYDRIVDGLRLMLWGLFKKVVVADRLAAIVGYVYQAPGDQPGPLIVLGTVFFAFQIYCDFSGYSDIAIGAARVMGFQLTTNFDRPYRAHSSIDFWRRWHISLSSWFRDYVYISLGGSRVSMPRLYWNVLIVFVLSGLWHGASWTFLAWGAFHGLYYSSSRLSAPIRARLVRSLRLEAAPAFHLMIQRGITFSLVCVGWVFFRAESMTQAWEVFAAAATGWDASLVSVAITQMLDNIGLSPADLGITVAAVVVLEAVERIQDRGLPSIVFTDRYRPIRWATYVATVLAIVNLGVSDEIPFIYFQF